MILYYDEVELEDFEYHEDEEIYCYPCPCGDQFKISMLDLKAGVEVATCDSCSLFIKVIYDQEEFVAKLQELNKGKEVQQTNQKVGNKL